jgi:hypothetical protein
MSRLPRVIPKDSTTHAQFQKGSEQFQQHVIHSRSRLIAEQLDGERREHLAQMTGMFSAGGGRAYVIIGIVWPILALALQGRYASAIARRAVLKFASSLNVQCAA